MIGRAGESLWRLVLDGVGRAASRLQESTPLPVDVLQSDDAFLVVFDAPGAAAGDVDLRYDAPTLRVRIDRDRETDEDYELRYPGRGQTLAGSVELPADAVLEAERAEATLTRSGTLEVLIPRLEEGDGDAVDGTPRGLEDDATAAPTPTDAAGSDES